MNSLIDENLPDRFKIWHGPDYENVPREIPAWSDERVWQHARRKQQVVVTKDVDFQDRILLLGPPPRVVHFNVGNLRAAQLAALVATVWPLVVTLLTDEAVFLIVVDEDGLIDAARSGA